MPARVGRKNSSGVVRLTIGRHDAAIEVGFDLSAPFSLTSHNESVLIPAHPSAQMEMTKGLVSNLSLPKKNQEPSSSMDALNWDVIGIAIIDMGENVL